MLMMTDKIDTTLAYVHRYRLFAPLDWGPDCEEEIARMRALWDRCVEIEEEHRAAVLAIGADDPAVREATAEAEALQARLDDLKTRRKTARMRARSKAVAADLDTEITALREQVAAAWQRAKEARKAARDKAREHMAMLENKRQQAVKLARQQSGCFWGNYNAVLIKYETARKTALRTGGTLRRAVTSRAQMTNQFIGGGTWDDALSPRGLGGQAWLRPHDLDRVRGGKPKPIYHLTWTMFRHDGVRRTVTAPMVLHRPIPEGAEIKELRVTREFVRGRKPEWYAIFVLRVPHESAATSSRACGIDVGWRRLNDGIRVGMLIDEDGNRRQIVLPERIVKGYEHMEALTADVDNRLNVRVARLRELPWSSAPAPLAEAAKAFCSAPKPTIGALARLVAIWREHETWHPIALKDAARTVRENDRDVRERAGLHRRLRAARRDHYRCEAARIVREYGLIGIEDLSVSQMMRREDNPTPEAARRYRTITAPAEFLESLRWAAKRRGVRIHAHSGPSTWICHACGSEHVPSDPSALIVQCPSCSAAWDQDVNAAYNLLAAARASAATVEESAGALAAGGASISGETKWKRAKRMAAEKRSARKNSLDTNDINGV